MVIIKDMEIKCPNCRKSTNVYPSKLEEHYVCITCCCIFMPKKKRGAEKGIEIAMGLLKENIGE